MSIIWAAALVAPLTPTARRESDAIAYTRGSVQALACLIVSWRRCLVDALPRQGLVARSRRKEAGQADAHTCNA